MMSSRSKGRYNENKAAAFMGGYRISRTGEAGSDIVDRNGDTWEVKVRKEFPAWLEDWMKQAAQQGDEGIILRRNHGQWFVLMPADHFKRRYLVNDLYR